MRSALGADAQYHVVKNKLTAIAAKDAGLDSLDGQFAGPTAIAFVQGDVVEAAKGLRDFAKANPELVIKGGVMDGQALSVTAQATHRDGWRAHSARSCPRAANWRAISAPRPDEAPVMRMVDMGVPIGR